MLTTTNFAIIAVSLTVIIIVAAYLLLERYLKHREREWAFILKQDNNKALSSLRITAFERITIMLERIAPTALVMRQNVVGSTAALLQRELIKSIREEFDHNISLQIYVSSETWERVRRAKDETAELIKVAYTKVRPESTGLELSQEILMLEASVGNSAIREAIFALRAEMSKNY